MADLFRLDGKVAVVVGGGGGIGRALALGLARQGATVALASRNLEKLQEVAAELAVDAEVKTPVKAFRMDSTDEESVKKAVQEIVSLPLFPELEEDEALRVVREILDAL